MRVKHFSFVWKLGSFFFSFKFQLIPYRVFSTDFSKSLYKYIAPIASHIWTNVSALWTRIRRIKPNEHEIENFFNKGFQVESSLVCNPFVALFLISKNFSIQFNFIPANLSSVTKSKWRCIVYIFNLTNLLYLILCVCVLFIFN